MRVRFITDTDAAWDEHKSKIFEVAPNDNAPRAYEIDMDGVPGWKGRLRQIRIDMATGEALTGTCRFDAIRIERRTP